MAEETALIKYEEINLDLVFSSRKAVDEILSKLKAAAEAHVPDLETDAGRKAVASNAYKVSQCKTWMIKHAKSMTEDWRKKTKTVNELRNHVEKFCDELRDSTRKPLTDLEEAEKAEREAQRQELERLADFDEAIEMNSLIDREREVARKEAEIAAAEAVRLEKERAEQAEKERKEREKRIAEEAAERAKREAQAAIEKAERDRLQAIENARLEKEAAELREKQAAERALEEKRLAVLAAEQKAKEEADKIERERLHAEAEKKRIEAEEKAKAQRLANHKAHQKSVQNAAIVCFERNGIENGQEIIDLIHDGRIDYITINY